MHTEAISNPIWALAKRLHSISSMNYAYPGGRTGLALQIGHRRSDDLDFYVQTEFDFSSFMIHVRQAGLDIKVINQTTRHTELMVQSIKLDLINEIIPPVFPLKPLSREIQTIKIADPRDIGRIKIAAIGSRGSKKDFVDLYCLTREITSLESLISMVMKENRGIQYSKMLFLKGLVDFEEADLESDPLFIWDINWEDVKRSLIKEVKEIAEKI